jgi:hypothetical protein
MRPSRPSPFLRPRSCGLTDATGASDAPTTGSDKKRCDTGSSDSGAKMLSADVPLWAAAQVIPTVRSQTRATRRTDKSDPQDARRHLRGAGDTQKAPLLSGQRASVDRAPRPDPLLTRGRDGGDPQRVRANGPTSDRRRHSSSHGVFPVKLILCAGRWRVTREAGRSAAEQGAKRP